MSCLVKLISPFTAAETGDYKPWEVAHGLSEKPFSDLALCPAPLLIELPFCPRAGPFSASLGPITVCKV